MSARGGCGDPVRETRSARAIPLLAVLLALVAVASGPPAVASTGDRISRPGGPGVPGEISVAPDGAPAPVTVSWSAATFAQAVTVGVDPRPVASTPGFLSGSANQVVEVDATDAQGAAVTTLAGPLQLWFTLPGGVTLLDHSPVVAADGATWRGLPECSGTRGRQLGTAQDDCFYLSGRVAFMWTRHLSVFGVIAERNVVLGESGRPLKPALSGLFGDVSLYHAGPPGVSLAGKVKVYPFAQRSGRAVFFRLVLDEQASVYVSVLRGDRTLPILLDGTMIGGTTRLTQKSVRTLHVTILRPGTLPIRLRLPASQLTAGGSYGLRIVALDYDGNRTEKLVSFRA